MSIQSQPTIWLTAHENHLTFISRIPIAQWVQFRQKIHFDIAHRLTTHAFDPGWISLPLLVFEGKIWLGPAD